MCFDHSEAFSECQRSAPAITQSGEISTDYADSTDSRTVAEDKNVKDEKCVAPSFLFVCVICVICGLKIYTNQKVIDFFRQLEYRPGVSYSSEFSRACSLHTR